MKNAKNTSINVWELALLLAFAAANLWGEASLSRQEDLGRKVIRLHVIANSDSPEDQALKLRVRDRVLARAQELLEQSADMAQAREVLTSALPELTREAQQVLAAAGCGDGVRARLEPAEFPTKDYDGFSLPAGKYLALRVIIGQGVGQNWWCVVFPPLCLGSVTETVEETACTGGFTRSEVALITGETEGYVVKFKAMELWDEFKEWTGRW